jgi:hypothetical protein
MEIVWRCDELVSKLIFWQVRLIAVGKQSARTFCVISREMFLLSAPWRLGVDRARL